ncbi:MAG: phenylacetate--CoA ligase [Deferribacteraceae bacterium]|jgi:phenylacetate-CoA ligase|nr:phenylacetate--CoA ligase [Deferribacteraceae bacterium]
MYWDPAYETLPREDMAKLQLSRLQKLAELVYNNVEFYRRKFDELKVKPSDIKSLDDIRRLPFTTKDDLRDNYPYKMFSSSLDDVVRIHASSGTTGKPTVVGYTRVDVDIWAETMARSFTAAGLTHRDIIQNAFGYGLFTGGLGAHYGIEKIGASVVPVSGGNSKRQIMFLKDFGCTGICCTPSYAASLLDAARDEGVDLRKLPVRAGLFGAEPWSVQMRREIEEGWGMTATDIYGLSEIIGPGVSFECPQAQRGLHVNEDHFYPEVIDPDTSEVLPAGEKGELVFTTITKEAIPLIRFRTRDISSIDSSPCSCGRTLIKMNKVFGRTDDMLIIRGVNVFPSQIEEVLLANSGLLPYYQIVVDKKGALDTVEVLVEVAEDLFVTDEIRKLQQREELLEKSIKSNVGITAKVRLVEPKTIHRSEGKAQRVIDKRERFV